MRAGLAAIAVLALCAAPAVAQGKTKPGAVPQSVAALEMCETFAAGDVLAVDDAIAKGWDAYEATGESPYVQTFNAHKELPGIGAADIFVLFEDYPQSTLGYCRMDVLEPQGANGDANRMLLAHWSAESFVVQLTIITPKAGDQN